MHLLNELYENRTNKIRGHNELHLDAIRPLYQPQYLQYLEITNYKPRKKKDLKKKKKIELRIVHNAISLPAVQIVQARIWSYAI